MSTEQIPCPCCSNELGVIGSRKRKYIESSEDKRTLVIRRLRCESCERIHHELPDFLVPYKRYDKESIEAVLEGHENLVVAADSSAIGRWKSWFNEVAVYLIGVLIHIAQRYGNQSAAELSKLPKSVLERIYHLLGTNQNWLTKLVRSVSNLNLWPHTCSAFLSS